MNEVLLIAVIIAPFLGLVILGGLAVERLS